MSDQSIISLDRVTKRFGSVTAVDDVNMEIGHGEFFALLGPSGCGKTTLLRMLGGFEVPDEGEIHIDGEPMSSAPPYRRPVNMVFQSYAIFPHLNVAQNIAFGLRKERLPAAELDAQVNEALAMIRLEGYGARKAHELSGGQRQRVALARALIKRPKVLLLDEPLGALDKKLREQMQIELRELQRSLGITFVFVTHDQEEALTMSDRIAVMSAGRLLEQGTPGQLYARPRNRFVADFLGAMNFFEGRIKGRANDRYVVEAERLGVVSAPSHTGDFREGDRVSIGLRPENIRITPAGNQTGKESISGTVSHAAYLGDRTHLYFTVMGSDEPVLVALQNQDGSGEAPGFQQASASLEWSDSVLLLFKQA